MRLRDLLERPKKKSDTKSEENEIESIGTTIFWLGIASLVFIPIFKILTRSLPFIGTFLGWR